MTSYASTLPSLRPSGAAGLVASAGLLLGGLVLAGIGVAIPIAEGFVARGALVASAGDAALLTSLAPIAPLLLVVGIAHVAIGLAVAQGVARPLARVLAVVDALVGISIVAVAAIAGASGTGDARSDLAGAGFLVLVVAIVVGTALRAGEPEPAAA